MALLSPKPITWAYSMITSGTEMLTSVFRFYYVKLFLHLDKLSEVAFYQAQCLALPSQSWLWKSGCYKVILLSFYLEGAASMAMLLLGQRCHYILALYFTMIMMTVRASFCLFNLPLADMVDADVLKFNRHLVVVDVASLAHVGIITALFRSPLSSMVSGINALFTKPAQSLASMVILSRLNRYGYGDPHKRQTNKQV